MKNELGGLAVLSGVRWHLFIDAYRRPKRSYFVPVAATYITWGGAVQRQLGKDFRARGQWQGRGRARWQDGLLRQERSSRVRFDLDWAPWRWRGEVQRFGTARRVEWGFMASMRLKGHWAILHLSRFHTASYATRIYEYEVDLPGTVSIRPLYGAGWRGYALFTLRCKGLALNVRYRVQRDRSFRYYGGVQVDWVRG